MTTIDAAKYHSGNGADTDEAACWHIVTFMLWCADRRLLAPQHSAEELRRDPVAYFHDRCGGKLWGEDLTPEGAAFAEAVWGDYGNEMTDLCVTHDISHTYDLWKQPNAEEIRGWLFEYLDEAFEDRQGAG
jgi:hypothetical protein